MNIGVIGGTGVYQLEENATPEKLDVTTPFGKPSGKIIKQTIGKNAVYFLPRHGEAHQITPSELNSRANIFALKKLGVEAVLSISAVGSMKPEIAPGDFVLPQQYIDRTHQARPHTFFGGGIVGHAHFAEPTCATLREFIVKAAPKDIKFHNGGTYVCIEGPQFSTRAESHLYRSWKIPGGLDVVGMTALPEARLAREANLCYQTVAMATDYDCWHEEKEDVTVEAIMAVVKKNVTRSKNLVFTCLGKEVPACQSGCRTSMKYAVVTPREKWPADKVAMMDVLLK